MASFRTEGRQGYVRLKPGKYAWKVEEAESAYKDGVEQIKLVLKVGTREQQMQIYETLTFSEKAFFRVEQFMKSAGIYPGDGVEVEIYPSSVLQLPCWCDTFDRAASNGKTYAEIDKWLEASSQRADFLPRRREVEEPVYRTEPVDDIPF
ncbi:MAG: hypothetical protein LUC93_00700 [Planctomycetaceae bacterium]|nr:hypothetical protein [Planctomycetaceae bacterium]